VIRSVAVLDHAVDGAPLWELLLGLQENRGLGVNVEVHPSLSVHQVRPVLGRALSDGHVEIYELSAPEKDLDLSAALTVVADPANWVPSHSGYGVCLTDSGREELQREYESRSSPH
jgi:hypothetical protein